MTHPEQDILRDSRGRIVQATIARDNHDDRFHFACCFCDGDFLAVNSCEAHIRVSHSVIEPNPIEPDPIIKLESPMDVNETIEILSDDELETISISSEEPEEVEPSTSANAQNPMIVPSMQNGIHRSECSNIIMVNVGSQSGPSVPSAAPTPSTSNVSEKQPKNMTNGEGIEQSQTIEPQSSPNEETAKRPTGNSATKTATPPDSTGNTEQMTRARATHTNGKQPSNVNRAASQPKPSTSKDDNASSEESDDDVSSISSVESQRNTASQRTENGQGPERDTNQSDMAQNYPCNHCPESFATFADYKKHEFVCDKWQKAMFPCPVEGCQKKYASRRSRFEHIDKKHGNYAIPCGICPQRFFSEMKKCEHQIQMHSKNEVKPCFFCGAECFSVYERNCHVKECHSHPNGKCFYLYTKIASVLALISNVNLLYIFIFSNR